MRRLCFVVGITLLVLLIYIFFSRRECIAFPKGCVFTSSNKCGECKTAPQHRNDISLSEDQHLLPILDPRFNLREAAKQMILLEDHLFNHKKRCGQCIAKHCLTIEGLLEEAQTLDKQHTYASEIENTLSQFRSLERDLTQGEDALVIADRLRGLRKPLHTKYFTVGI